MDVIVPKLGLTVERAEILNWCKAVGDEVSAGDVLVEIAADKADVEVQAETAGVLVEILAEAGEEVAFGTVIGRIDGVDAVSTPAAAPTPDATVAPAGENGRGNPTESAERPPVRSSPLARRAADSLGVPVDAVAGSGPGGKVLKADVERAGVGAPSDGGEFALGLPRSSPAARRLATELGVDLARAAPGGGPRGRVVEADVRRAASDAPAPSDAASELVPYRWSAARRTTARRVAESARETVPVTLHRRADARAALGLAATLKQDGVPATFTHVLMSAVASALREHPDLNAVWDGDALMQAKAVHLGLAVDANRQLLMPVVRSADALTIAELAHVSNGLVARCRSGTLEREDTLGATFAISNLGMLGVEQFTPVINLPQVAILGVGATVSELVPTGEGFAARSRCHLSLTFDHRAVDGAPAARFLADAVERLERVEGPR